MKKTLAFILEILMLSSMLLGCAENTNSAQSTSVSQGAVQQDIDVTTYYKTHKFPEKRINEKETVITAPAGSVLDVDATFIRYTEMAAECDKPGTFERVDYTTSVYEDGKTYEKFVNVYLPYGYDPNRAEPYNVLYFQHGHSQSVDLFTKNEQYKKWLDNLFASGKVEPLIIVCTTFYFNQDSTPDGRTANSEGPAGDGNYEGIPGNFWMEVTQDIIPTVEAKYNTYAKSYDAEGLIAARDHRGFSGYSRGSCCTWYMFHYALPYFRWYAPMSGSCTAGHRLGENTSDEEAYQYLKETVDANPDLPFFIYVISGGPKDAEGLRLQMAYFKSQSLFSYGNDSHANNLYYALSNFEHSDCYAAYYYYNSLQILFH